jgi:hypothetical protein
LNSISHRWCCTYETGLSEKVRYQGLYGEGRDLDEGDYHRLCRLGKELGNADNDHGNPIQGFRVHFRLLHRAAQRDDFDGARERRKSVRAVHQFRSEDVVDAVDH